MLGLYDPADSTDWGPIRAAQLHAGRQLAVFMLAANVIGAALITIIASRALPVWMPESWAALTASVAAAVTFRRLSSAHRDAISASVEDVRATLADGIALGAVWAAPPLAAILLMHGAAPEVLGIWVVLAVLMVASAVAMAALPLATLAFLLLTGAGTVAMLYVASGAMLAAASAMFVLLVLLGCVDRARSLVVIRANEIAMAERDETVALLLRDGEAREGESDDGTADWLWEIDAGRRVVRANRRFAYAAGLDPVKINNMPFLQVLAGPAWETGNFSESLRDLAAKLKQREQFRGLVVKVRVNDTDRWWEIAATPRYDDSGTFIGFRGVGSDVTEARASADQISRMARFDMLTGLPNRLLINETLAKAMADAEKWSSRCAFIMIDLDRFKAVNDTLGHPVGDRLLGRVAQRLAQIMTDNEMVGRLGGDEFAVVVRDATDTARLERLATNIIESVSRPYEIDQHRLYIGASLGVAVGPRDGRTAEMLVRSADLALYRSKDAGGGVFHLYEPQLHMQAEERRVLEIALREAVRKGEMHLVYQPVVSAEAEGLTAFEALLRWTHPELGPISPDKFIPLAEEARLIAPIGEWVLRTACQEAAAWPGQMTVSVNVSADQLTNPNFVSIVTSALAQSGLPPARLELEVTESVFMREGTGATKVLERILDLGVRLALDDFGTGYSSLGYLSQTRFSTIKIDRSFVQAAAKGKKEAIAIIRAVVALADSLGMATTAEGVESEAQHYLVRDLGCTKVQGYYFSRPLPAAEARAIVLRAVASSKAA
ncbi:MAG: putative bifunctional diguanylate cyclase/phosphodiesterase [Sphingomonas sp.]